MKGNENTKKETEKDLKLTNDKTYIYFDNQGVVCTTNKKYFIKD